MAPGRPDCLALQSLLTAVGCRSPRSEVGLIPEIVQHRQAVEELCRRRHVRRLELFGSAATGQSFGPESDFDFLVEFEPLVPSGYADAYFGLLEDLVELLGRPVDLVDDTAIKNPYFRQSVDQSRVLLYAA